MLTALKRSDRQFLLLMAIASVCTVAVTSLALSSASATAAGNRNSLTVSPARLDYTLKESQGAASIQSKEVTISNNYDVPLRISAQLRGIDEAANLIVPSGAVEKSLEAAIALSETDITLAARSTQTITVQVTNVPDLKPGGHYATILLTPVPAAFTNISSQPSLRSSLSISLFIVKQIDGAQALLNIEALSFSRNLFSIPDSVSVNVKNQGLVHGVPRAVVSVRSSDGLTELFKGIANQQSLTLLPGRQAVYDVALTSLPASRLWVPQRLQLIAQYRFDGSAEAQSLTRSFWYVPPGYLLLLPLVLVLGWYGLRRVRLLLPRAQSATHQPKQLDNIGHATDPATNLAASGLKPALGQRAHHIVVADHDEPTIVPVIIVKKAKASKPELPVQYGKE